MSLSGNSSDVNDVVVVEVADMRAHVKISEGSHTIRDFETLTVVTGPKGNHVTIETIRGIGSAGNSFLVTMPECCDDTFTLRAVNGTTIQVIGMVSPYTRVYLTDVKNVIAQNALIRELAYRGDNGENLRVESSTIDDLFYLSTCPSTKVHLMKLASSTVKVFTRGGFVCFTEVPLLVESMSYKTAIATVKTVDADVFLDGMGRTWTHVETETGNVLIVPDHEGQAFFVKTEKGELSGLDTMYHPPVVFQTTLNGMNKYPTRVPNTKHAEIMEAEGVGKATREAKEARLMGEPYDAKRTQLG